MLGASSSVASIGSREGSVLLGGEGSTEVSSGVVEGVTGRSCVRGSHSPQELVVSGNSMFVPTLLVVSVVFFLRDLLVRISIESIELLALLLHVLCVREDELGESDLIVVVAVDTHELRVMRIEVLNRNGSD